MSFSFEQAQRVAAQQRPLGAEQYALHQALGKVLARNVVARCEVSHYHSAAMDGFAVNNSGDFRSGPWSVVGATPRDGDLDLAPGEAATIVTGGSVPAQATSVVRIEHTVLDGQQLSLHRDHKDTRDITTGAHIRTPGAEVSTGDTVVAAGMMLGPAEIAATAVAGVDHMSCYRPPQVGFVFTGDEVLTEGIPRPGYVRDAFSPYFVPLIQRLNHGSQLVPADAVYQERIGDDFQLMIQQLERAASSVDVLVTTGGTGFSSADYLRRGLDELRAEYLVPEIDMRPGHPTVLAQLPSGTYVLGLPGNPLAALAGFVAVGMPLLAALSGVGELKTFTGSAGLSATTQKPSKHRPNKPSPLIPRLVPAVLRDGVVEASSFQGSAMLRGLAGAEFFALTYPDATAVGDELLLLPLPWATFDPA